jgi:hypothetical protein
VKGNPLIDTVTIDSRVCSKAIAEAIRANMSPMPQCKPSKAEAPQCCSDACTGDVWPQGAGYHPLQDERTSKPTPRERIEREVAALKARIKRLESGDGE